MIELEERVEVKKAEAKPSPKCSGCSWREGRIQELEHDYFEIMQANVRMLLFMKRHGLKLPGNGVLKRWYPLSHQEAFRPKRVNLKLRGKRGPRATSRSSDSNLHLSIKR